LVPSPSIRESEDLLVTSLSIQGGEAAIAGKRTAFARVIISGVPLEDMKVSSSKPPTRQAAVLKLDTADELILRLREIMNSWARSSPTPILPARGIWSWTSEPPPRQDILVSQITAERQEITAGSGATPIVRLDFNGTFVGDLSSSVAPARMPGAIFTVPRHVQSLISSLKKCTLALRPEAELQFLGFSLPSLEASSRDMLQSACPHQ
jgi:hypothetical protein